jgi:hypothetical protein
VREYPSAAGNNALEDERRAASGMLEEMDLLEGDQRFSEGVAERRGADFSATPDFYYQVFRAPPSPQAITRKKNQGRTTPVAVSAREPRCLRFPSARPPRLADRLRILFPLLFLVTQPHFDLPINPAERA